MAFRNLCKNPLGILNNDEIRKIHDATLQILEETGVRFQDEKALNLLSDSGCNVDHKNEIVRFPPGLVEKTLKQCPPTFTLHARNPAYDIVFEPQSVYFAACSGMDIFDPKTMQRRPGCLKDVEEAARLCNALEAITNANAGVSFISDKPREVNLEWRYATTMRNSEKIPGILLMGDAVMWGLKAAQLIGTDVLLHCSSASPLGWSKAQIEGVRSALEAGQPVGIQSMASPGLTAPATLGGTLIVMNAEILAMAVFVQLIRSGTGVMYSCFTLPMDMRFATFASGSMELSLLTAISAQLSRFYGMGSVVFEPMSDSKIFDQQTGYEKAMQCLLAGMSGINLIWGAGQTEGQRLWSHAQLIIDTEMCEMVGRYLKGVRITEETLAVNLIKEVGHFPQSYLDTDHTFRFWKDEQYQPMVANRQEYNRWKEAGAKDIVARAEEHARQLLEKHQPVPLPEDVDRELSNLLKKAARAKGII